MFYYAHQHHVYLWPNAEQAAHSGLDIAFLLKSSALPMFEN